MGLRRMHSWQVRAFSALGEPSPEGSPTHVTRDRDTRGDGWVAPLWWTDGVGQADPSHLRLRRT